MKKYIIFVLTAILCVALLSACKTNVRWINKDLKIEEIEIDGETYLCFHGLTIWDWPNQYTESIIPDQETAISYAKSIFQGMKNGRLAKKYVPTELFFDEEQEVWITTFSRKGQDLEKAEGDCYRIAVQKSDGTVLRIWHEK